jgi:hypothetical protein
MDRPVFVWPAAKLAAREPRVNLPLFCYGSLRNQGFRWRLTAYHSNAIVQVASFLSIGSQYPVLDVAAYHFGVSALMYPDRVAGALDDFGWKQA